MFNVTPPTKRSASPSTSRSTKFSRTSFSPSISDAQLRQQINHDLTPDQMRTLLLQVVQSHPAAKSSITSLIASMTKDDPKKDFQDVVKKAEWLMNEKYARAKGRVQFEKASVVALEIEGSVQGIVMDVQAITRNGHMAYKGHIHHGEERQHRAEGWTTWYNGFDALADIGMAILHCSEGEIAKVDRGHGTLHIITDSIEGLICDLDHLDTPSSPECIVKIKKLSEYAKMYGIDAFESTASKLDSAKERSGEGDSDRGGRTDEDEDLTGDIGSEADIYY